MNIPEEINELFGNLTTPPCTCKQWYKEHGINPPDKIYVHLQTCPRSKKTNPK